jgi:hypothetical protein
MGESKGFVQISIEAYNNLMDSKRTLESILQSDKCIEVSSLYSYDTGGAVYLYNPDLEVKEIIDTLVKEKNQSVKTYLDWAGKDKNKRVRLWHIGKTIQQVIDNKWGVESKPAY